MTRGNSRDRNETYTVIEALLGVGNWVGFYIIRNRT